jgi:hypothetical protein
MKNIFRLMAAGFIYLLSSCISKTSTEAASDNGFAPEMVEFEPYANNPVFTHGDSSAWDNMIRERGFILKEDSIYKMWYTGYKNSDTAIKYLGYATSNDGIKWERSADNPIFTDKWTEDMIVFKHDGKYHMYTEGYKVVAHFF